MKMQAFSKILLACCGFAFVHQSAHAQIDGAFIQKAAPPRAASTGNETPDYDSDYAAAARLTEGADNTPEADARPGEYYFRLGAHAFRTKNYTFAIQMYQVSASWAYKPAEYNIAVMYARGDGVPADLPRAMAWIALAAERNEKHYVDAREAVYAEMSKEQFDQANAIWRELKTTYGDEVALRRAKARWAEVRAHMTGSRVGSQAAPLIVSLPTSNSGNPSHEMNRPSMGSRARNDAARSAVTTAAEIVGSQTADGTMAYRQLRESNNPYDPKFDRTAFGTTLVGPPTPADTKKETKPGNAEPSKQNE